MTKPLRIAHISDLHFGRTDRAVVNGLRDHLNGDPPDVVVVGGDLTQKARRSEFEQAKAFLQSLTSEVLVIPGNHDLPGWTIWNRFLKGYRHYRTYIDEDLDVFQQLDNAVLVGLNTSRKVVFHWNWSHGALSRRQLTFAQRALEDAPDTAFKLVALHHPLVPPQESPKQKLVGNASKAVEVFAKHRVDIVLTGHLHTMQTQLTGQYHPALPWQFPVVQTATSTSTRLRGQDNGLTEIHWTGDRMEIGSWIWQGADFQLDATHVYEREPERGWMERA